jgi:DNA-binding MarR family transcriptional regulator
MLSQNPKTSQEISSSFIETLVLIHRNFYRNLTVPVPLNQFATLMTLRLEKSASITEMGQALLISKQQMSNICDKLLQAGLVTKTQDQEDRRRTLISLRNRPASPRWGKPSLISTTADEQYLR